MKAHVLITGADSPTAVRLMNAIANDVIVWAAESDAAAPGLTLVPVERRLLVPPGDHAGFVDRVAALCEEHCIDVVIPTHDTELLPMCVERGRLERIGVGVMVGSMQTLLACLDRFEAIRQANGVIGVPDTKIFDGSFRPASEEFPVVVKPRRGGATMGGRVIWSTEDLDNLPRDPQTIAQEFLSGAEYSVDVLTNRHGELIDTVARQRLRVNPGVTITCDIAENDALAQAASTIATAIGLRGAANLRFRYDGNGSPRLLEVNAAVETREMWRMWLDELLGVELVSAADTGDGGEGGSMAAAE
jgi:carbamoyl-phosphate synthase large subunit